ncbi:keratin-associated protein 24-1 [Artibeus jamaicensis]|uniref:keratin-associated protein 24-1 n=1 Tax=Artibeus jamaicensis TaxID=9417 RepID=UPI00235B1964|nr:keratin-associated protein 24-1 [Artibeus jamaicensis]
MCLLGPSGDSYVPMVTPVAFCSGDVSPTFGLGLPSSCQGNLWLLDYCPDAEGSAPSCRPRPCTAGGAPWGCCEPCDPAAEGTMCGARDTAGGGPRPRPGPGAQTVGRTAPVCAPSPRVPAERRTLATGPQRLGRLGSVPRTSGLLPHCRPSGLRHRSYQTLGFTPGGFSSSCGAASACHSQNYWVRSCPPLRHRPASCSPRSYFSSTLGSLSCLPGSFPPLRYLRPGCY